MSVNLNQSKINRLIGVIQLLKRIEKEEIFFYSKFGWYHEDFVPLGMESFFYC